MIEKNTKKILNSLPEGVKLVAAVKGRKAGEIEQAVSAGVKIVGENYLKQAKVNYKALKPKVSWHFIGHLQKNKVRKAVKLFDMIETVDSLKLAEAINKECEKAGKVMPVLIEVNSAAEPQKYGVPSAEVMGLYREIAPLPCLKACGLMTMGPFLPDPEKIRPYFRKTKQLFAEIQNRHHSPDWTFLSMGMSASYKIALEEGANMVRVGTAIFGPRPGKNE